MRRWRRKVDVKNDVDSTIRRTLDQGLPETPYMPDIFTSKVQLVFDHVLTAYGDNGQRAYIRRIDITFPSQRPIGEYAGTLDVDKIADDVVTRICDDPAFAARGAGQLEATERLLNGK